MGKEQIFQMNGIMDAINPNIDLCLHMCGTTYPNRNYLIHRPSSKICCMEYIVSGEGEVHVGDQVFYPKVGDTYFLPAGLDHRYFSNRRNPWEKIWINFSGDYAMQLTTSYGLQGKYYFPNLDTSDLLSKMQYYATHSDSTSAAEQCVSILSRLFFRLSQSTFSSDTQAATPLEKMIRYIERHKTEPIRLEQLAAVSGKSASQAERLFSSSVGMPIYRYILEQKIELAKSLLRETGMPIHEIASYLSFEDAFYFSGLFRRKVGCSPTQYRKMEESASK